MTAGETKRLFLATPLGEATICARCGACNAVCCTHREQDWESTSPRGWLTILRSLSDGSGRIASIPQGFVERVFNCTTCGKCGQACPVHIDLRRLWLSLREEITERGQEPAFVGKMIEVVDREKNVFDFPNEERAEWVEFMSDAPDHRYQKDKAEVLFYVGCVSSFSPGAQGITRALAKVLEDSGTDFSILGGEEWCCGFPLMVAGSQKEAQALIEHNRERLHSLGARTVVFNCPSCYHMWKHEYHLEGIELLHHTEFLARLISQRRLNLGKVENIVTYHDPCDLGRNSGVYDAPREVLKSIPGLTLVEMLHNQEEALCCGGGGDFEMLAPAMTQKIATRLVQEAVDAGAQRLVVACPQCKRVEMSGVEALSSQVGVIDIAELVREAMLSAKRVESKHNQGGADGPS